MQMTIDHHQVSEECTHCGLEYEATGGTLYHDGETRAWYLAGMHPCSNSARVVLLSIVFMDPDHDHKETCEVLLRLHAEADYHGVAVQEPHVWPWVRSPYEGRRLSRQEVLSHRYKDWIFEASDTILAQNSEIKLFLDGAG